MKQFLFIRR